ncbi:MAG: cytochrome c-type biogenesis protein CcmH [Alphaproteobacteria bacterium]|nr:cytochrome c-type biogenesis protein CcmH [Alphaproteobacteria bacterium]
MRAALAAALVAVTVGLAAPPARAVGANEALPDPALEARARELFKELRCLVCQNQSIDDSDAELARDLRILVRERLLAGDSNEEIIRFLTSRYGDFVLLKPPLKASTVALWTAPFALLLIGGAVVVLRLRARRTAREARPLDAQERARLRALLDDDGDDGGKGAGA